MSTTYIIGAGASRHAAYPLAWDMGSGVIDSMRRMPVPFPQQAHVLTEQFGTEPNIEEMITQLGVLVESGTRAMGPFSPGNLRGYIGSALREWFRHIHTGPAAAYAEFANKLARPRDVIITFNYDDSLERELKRSGKWEVSSGYGFPFAESARSSEVLVLKLHGSMNWLWPVPVLGERPVIHRADLTHLGYTDPSEFTGFLFGNGGAIPCLILPDREKKFSYKTSFGIECRGFWDGMWEQAGDVLRRSQHLVLCCYSLLPVDQRACALLLEEPRKEAQITVVSGDQSRRIATDLGNAGFKNVDVPDDGFFEHWVHQEAELGIAHSN